MVLLANVPELNSRCPRPFRLKCRTPSRPHISLTSAESPSSSSHTSSSPRYTISFAARSVRSAIATGSFPGTIVVMNATRSRGSGATGTGSHAARHALDTVTTFASRNSCITIDPPAIAPSSTRYASAPAPCSPPRHTHPPRSGYCDSKTSQ